MKLAHLRDLSLCNDLGARLYQAAATYYKQVEVTTVLLAFVFQGREGFYLGAPEVMPSFHTISMFHFNHSLTQNISPYFSEFQTFSPPKFLYLPTSLLLLLLVVDKYDRLSGTRQFCRALTYPVRAAAAAPQRRRTPQLRRVVTAIIIFGCHQGPITVFQHPFLHALRTIFIHHQASWHPPRPHSAHQLSAFVACFNGTV